jgi:hypothetical protein
MLRTQDVFARYGGEEFCVLLSGCSADEAVATMEHFRAATPYGQTFSAGLAMWDGVETPEHLLGRADGALYEAKHGGRDRIVLAGSRPSAPQPTPPSAIRRPIPSQALRQPGRRPAGEPAGQPAGQMMGEPAGQPAGHAARSSP